jgi:hypothetical protein
LAQRRNSANINYGTFVMKILRYFLLSLMLFPYAASVSATADQNALLKQVKEFYAWVLINGKFVAALQPVIRDMPGGRFALDTSNQDNFTSRLLASGYFAPEFKHAVAGYYDRYQRQFAALTAGDFEAMAHDGRGPLMEVEDMDIFFCAQEYEYRPSFIDELKIKQFKGDNSSASLVIVSPYGWETPFTFVFTQGRWLISGYCVFQ